jgi:hypothetical protein
MYLYKSKYAIASKPSFRNKKGADIEEIDVSIPTAKWEKFKNKYEYYKNSDIVGIVEILDSTHAERYKWSTDKGTGFEKYLYKAQTDSRAYSISLYCITVPLIDRCLSKEEPCYSITVLEGVLRPPIALFRF